MPAEGEKREILKERERTRKINEREKGLSRYTFSSAATVSEASLVRETEGMGGNEIRVAAPPYFTSTVLGSDSEKGAAKISQVIQMKA